MTLPSVRSMLAQSRKPDGPQHEVGTRDYQMRTIAPQPAPNGTVL